jgi:hypothetical protein
VDAILYKKLIAEGTNRTIPRDWFASQKYSIPPAFQKARGQCARAH